MSPLGHAIIYIPLVKCRVGDTFMPSMLKISAPEGSLIVPSELYTNMLSVWLSVIPFMAIAFFNPANASMHPAPHRGLFRSKKSVEQVELAISIISELVRFGLAWSHWAIMPATIGDDIDVPEAAIQ